MKIITITNLKGGVGKTTTAINLAHYLSANGHKVLLLDTDHQANLSKFYQKQHDEDNVHRLLTKRKPIRPQAITENLHIIPSDVQTATINFELTARDDWQFALQDVLREDIYNDNYDYCVIDCPPALDLIVTNTLVVADYVLIPLTTGQFAFDGLQSIMERIASAKKRYNPNLEVLGILLTIVSERTRAAKSIQERLKENDLSIKTCHARIRQCEAFKQAELTHQSVFEYDPKCNGAIDMAEFCEEVMQIFSK